jgi:hypothetical protein
MLRDQKRIMKSMLSRDNSVELSKGEAEKDERALVP